LTGDTLEIDKANFVVLNIPDKDPTNEIQSLRKTSDSLFISKANGIRLLDDDSTNEIQNLRKTSDSLFISKANGIRLLDDDSTNEIQSIFIRNDSLFITKNTYGIPLTSINNNRNPNAFDTLIYSNELADTIYTSYEFLPTNRDADLKSTFVDNWYKSVVVGDSLYFMGHYYNWSNNTFKVYVQMVNLNNLDAIKITTVDSISSNIQSDAKQFHGLLKTNETQFYWTFQDSIFLYNPLTKKSNSLFIGFSNNFKDIAFDLYFNSFQKKVSGSDYILSGDTVVFCRQRLNPNFPIGSSNFYIDTLSFFELDLNQKKETRIHDVKMEVLLSNGTKSRFDFSKVNIPGLISRNTYAIFTNYVYLENVLQPFYGLTLINPHAKTNNTYKINRASISTSGIIASPGILSKVPCKKDLYYAPGGVINKSESKYFNSVLGGLIEPTSNTNNYTPISFSRTVPWNDKHLVIKGFVPGYSTSNIISVIPDNNCRTDE
jgi:hypothetical protein